MASRPFFPQGRAARRCASLDARPRARAWLFSAVLVAATLAGSGAWAADSADAVCRRAEEKLATRKSDDLLASLDLFLEAARLDPAHARAHAGAATAASLLALYSVASPRPLFATARQQAEAALELDPALAPAQAAMGLVEYLDAWKFEAAESRLREALRLDPSYAQAWHWYGMLLQATSRFDESLAAFDRAIAIEPGSALYAAKRAGVLAAAGRTGEAERELRLVIERFAGSGLARRELGYLLVSSGRAEEGIAQLRRAGELSGVEPEENPDLAWGCARGGRPDEAERIVVRLLEAALRAEASGGMNLSASDGAQRTVAVAGGLTGPLTWGATPAPSFVSPLDLALAYAGLDRADDALRWLDRALEIRDPGLVYLGTAPGFAPLRGEARFAALLETIGLPNPNAGALPESSERVAPHVPAKVESP